MSIFDKLKSTAGQAVNAAAQSIGSKRNIHLHFAAGKPCRNAGSAGQASTHRLKRQHLRFLPSVRMRRIRTSVSRC